MDHATSRLMHLHCTQTESTFSYFEATVCTWSLMANRWGRTGDKASVFRSVKVQELAASTFTEAYQEENTSVEIQ
nr:hypothetical protein [Burkholderia gladioli]